MDPGHRALRLGFLVALQALSVLTGDSDGGKRRQGDGNFLIFVNVVVSFVVSLKDLGCC